MLKFKKRVNEFPTPYTCMRAVREGGVETKLSMVLMGFGNIVHKQKIKGLLYLAVEVAYLVFMAVYGVGFLGMLGSLGSVPQKEVWDEANQVYLYTQGDQSVLTQIGTQVISEQVDAVIPIATLAAQVMATCAEDTKTPVVYAAISDPEAAEMTDIDYVTGTSDALNTKFILDMMLAQDPEVKKVGLLYSLSEDNSKTPIAEAKAYLEEKGIGYTEKTANTNDEVITAASALIAEDVDAIFTPTDNVIMSAELAIYESLAEAGIPHYTGADSFVRNGAFATCGVNYTDLGHETADLAYTAMTEGMDSLEDFYLAEGGIITVNTETAQVLGVDYSVFKDMGTLVEVGTTED